MTEAASNGFKLKQPPAQLWKIVHFSSLEFLEYNYFEFHLSSSCMAKFVFCFAPVGYHFHLMDSVRIDVDYGKNYGIRSEVLYEKYRHMKVHFALSFLGTDGAKYGTQEAVMPLFKEPDELFERDVHFSVLYEFLTNPDIELLKEDELTILIEGEIMGHPIVTSSMPNPPALHQDRYNLNATDPIHYQMEMAKSADCYDTQYTWTVANISTLLSSDPIQSPDIRAAPVWQEAATFNLELFPEGFMRFSGADNDSIFITLICAQNSKPRLAVRYSIAIVDDSGRKCLTQRGQAIFSRCSEINNSYFRISRAYLLDPANRLVDNDSLTLFCEIYCGKI